MMFALAGCGAGAELASPASPPITVPAAPTAGTEAAAGTSAPLAMAPHRGDLENWDTEWRSMDPEVLPPRAEANPVSNEDPDIDESPEAANGEEALEVSGSVEGVDPAPVEPTDEWDGKVDAAEDQSVAIPAEYTVDDGDTLSQIAECFGLRASDLALENQLPAGHRLRVGDVLRIPPSATQACEVPEKAPQPNCAPVTRAEARGLSQRCLYRVRTGESFSSIAARRGLTTDGLLGLNRCTTDSVQRGQVIRLCSAPKQRVRTRAKAAPEKPTAGQPKPPPKSPPSEPALQLPKPPDCRSVVRDDEKLGGAPRAVLFANGDAVRLFELYVKELSARGGDTDWAMLTITLVDESGAQVRLQGEQLTFGETMLGLSDIKKWKRRLKGRKAAWRSDPQRDAQAMNADLMCLPAVQ